MPALQDTIVALIAVAAGLLIARRRFGLRFGSATPAAVGCEKCASGAPCAPGSAASTAPVTAHPLKLMRAPRRPRRLRLARPPRVDPRRGAPTP